MTASSLDEEGTYTVPCSANLSLRLTNSNRLTLQVLHHLEYQQTSMKSFSTVSFLGFAATLVTARMTPMERRQAAGVVVCPGSASNAQCCATDVLGLADLNCNNRELALIADPGSKLTDRL